MTFENDYGQGTSRLPHKGIMRNPPIVGPQRVEGWQNNGIVNDLRGPDKGLWRITKHWRIKKWERLVRKIGMQALF